MRWSPWLFGGSWAGRELHPGRGGPNGAARPASRGTSRWGSQSTWVREDFCEGGRTLGLWGLKPEDVNATVGTSIRSPGLPDHRPRPRRSLCWSRLLSSW